MSQNFSKMSEIYIPELMELDSYWQKAVEDAIYDTLKGEKRLYYALKNRKKINKKLKTLGLKPMSSQISFSGRGHVHDSSAKFKRGKSRNRIDWDSCVEDSATTIGSKHEEDDFMEIPDGVPGTPPRVRSRSRSKNIRSKSPQRKKTPNSDRPLLGDGSLEKMKKSQNSFNCELMGSFENDEKVVNEWEEEDVVDDIEGGVLEGRKSKSVKWLHVGRDDAFEDSDTETHTGRPFKNVIEKNGFQKNLTLKDLNYFLDGNIVTLSGTSKKERVQKNDKSQKKEKINRQSIPMTWGPQEDVFWENEVISAIRENAKLERRLCFALAKRDIINRRKGALRELDNSNKILIKKSLLKSRMGRNIKLLSPYNRFYLKVYKDLCHKYPVKEINVEAARRWEALKENVFATQIK